MRLLANPMKVDTSRWDLMVDSSLSSKILKGALVAYYAKSQQPRTIVFQLNPESIQRRILTVTPE